MRLPTTGPCFIRCFDRSWFLQIRSLSAVMLLQAGVIDILIHVNKILTQCNAGMHNMLQNNEEVKEATLFLFDVVIPEFSAWMDALPSQQAKKLSLTEAIHRKGINCRHLGRIRASSKNELARRQILTEVRHKYSFMSASNLLVNRWLLDC